MELDIPSFSDEYNIFNTNRDRILFEVDSMNVSLEPVSVAVSSLFKNLDVKMRLAFGILEIKLNNHFVSDKEDDLKLCHLLYYKLADLWYAYETYIKFDKSVFGVQKDKILWLNRANNEIISSSPCLSHSLIIANHALNQEFGANKNSLLNYFSYCIEDSKGSQIGRLTRIIEEYSAVEFNLSHSDLLTITYAIRNNFVHNGETTVVPDIFGYVNKSRLLSILYKHLSIVLVKAVNTTCIAIQQNPIPLLPE